MATANEFTYGTQTLKSGDQVIVDDGVPGIWTIIEFARNPRDTNGEWCASLVDGRKRLFWPAHQLLKV